jgi:hypothetical protein
VGGLASQDSNPSQLPLNGQYIQGCTGYAASPISLHGRNFSSIQALPNLGLLKNNPIMQVSYPPNSLSQKIQFLSTILCNKAE